MTDGDGTASAPLTGTQLGRYVLGERIGAGGAASVYLAILRGPGGFERVLAVKIVHEHLLESVHFVGMFLDEANLAVRLSHPNIVHTYELVREDDALFLAMEYLHGQPLSRLIERARDREERLSPELVAWIGARALAALGYAHGLIDDAGNALGIVHRDVSPENVFLTYDGRVVLIDFGIARAEGRVVKTGGRIKGKLGYMAPEQMLRQPIDHRADLFALGASLYEASVGKKPFDAHDEAEASALMLDDTVPPPSTYVPGFPEALSSVLLSAMERDPDARPNSAADMAHDLDHFAGQGASATSLSELMAIYFDEERSAQEAAIAALRTSRLFLRSLPPGLTTTADPTASTIRPVVHERPSRWALVALAGALAMAIASVVAVRMSASGAASDSMHDSRKSALPSGSPAAPAATDVRATAEQSETKRVPSAQGPEAGTAGSIP
jgi:serine/threonine-protein kinase